MHRTIARTLAGATGIWFGYPVADPLVGLLIAVVILHLV
jgi:divalent metal cation (Fe/Co/Zn/Cd) transporter